LKAISLWQPWASLIAHGVKTIETRSWAPPKSLLGQRIAIHAAKRRVSSDDPGFNDQVANILGYASVMQSATTSLRNNLPRGAVLCITTLEGVMQVRELKATRGLCSAAIGDYKDSRGIDRDRRVITDEWGDFSVGRWLWFLRVIEVLPEPLEVAGRQRLFDIEIPESEGVSP
jgi:hypothetical protein